MRGTAASRPVGLWLVGCAALVFAMIVLGGVTRLTESGLSIVTWRPVAGVVPPLSEAAWEEAFAAYRAYPEYRQVNRGMTLGDFKTIYWFEYAHRLLGRLIGVVFLAGLVGFALRRRIDRRLTGWLSAIFAGGALQGVLGWWMVASGLVDRPDVSHYRLTAHLAAAVVLYGLILWTAFGLLRPAGKEGPRGGPVAWIAAVLALVCLTILSGGLVAGLDAGFAYNTFPLMGEGLIPPDALALEPAWLNLVENVATVQFQHRVLALSTAVAVAVLWLFGRRRARDARVVAALHLVLAVAVMQLGLGIATLLLYVPIPVAAMHQAGAILLFTATLWALHAAIRARANAA
jgi:cytochrome c oxidase assembly protein subunit 15